LKQEKNQPLIGANPPFGRIESDLRTLTFAIQLRCLAHPFIGTVRANPVAAPAPIIDLPLDLISWISVKRIFFILRTVQWISPSREALGRRQDLPERSRWRDEPSCW